MQREAAEFLTYLPQWKSLYEEMISTIALLSDSVKKEYQEYSQIQSQKEFAIAIAQSKYRSFLFKLRSGKVKTVQQCLALMPHKAAYKYLGAKFCQIPNKDTYQPNLCLYLTLKQQFQDMFHIEKQKSDRHHK